jgi:hypothetical protein
VSGWGNFFDDIKTDDKATYEDKKTKAAEFAASGEQHTFTEVYRQR